MSTTGESNEFDEDLEIGENVDVDVDVDVEDVGTPLTLSSAPNAVPMPVTSKNREIAALCAAQQQAPEKAEQVRRNMLAVLVIQDYLNLQDYRPDLETSDCWSPVRRQLDDIADLVVTGIGRLECRVFEADQELCLLPEEVQVDRMGYVGVQFDQSEHWAWLLGFVPALSATEPVEGIRRAELRSMDEFGGHLYRLRMVNQILAQKLNSPRLQAVSGMLADETAVELDAVLREEAIAMLERLYRTVPARNRSRQAAREILGFMAEVGGDAGLEPQMATLGDSAEAGALERAVDELSLFFSEVFRELNDVLKNEE